MWISIKGPRTAKICSLRLRKRGRSRRVLGYKVSPGENQRVGERIRRFRTLNRGRRGGGDRGKVESGSGEWQGPLRRTRLALVWESMVQIGVSTVLAGWLAGCAQALADIQSS